MIILLLIMVVILLLLNIYIQYINTSRDNVIRLEWPFLNIIDDILLKLMCVFFNITL